MQKIKKLAKVLNIKPGKLRKDELIKHIQSTEGNYPCFGTAEDYCDQFDCRWREDCLPH